MESPRNLMPLILTPAMDWRSIMELIEYGPALWSTTRCSLSSGGLETTCTGTTFIPGRSVSKGSEKRSALISFWHCNSKTSCSQSFFGGCCGLFIIVGPTGQFPGGCKFRLSCLTINAQSSSDLSREYRILKSTMMAGCTCSTMKGTLPAFMSQMRGSQWSLNTGYGRTHEGCDDTK